MNKKIIFLILVVSFFTIFNFSKIALADGNTLSNYPSFLYSGGLFNAYIVPGYSASSDEIALAPGISSSLNVTNVTKYDSEITGVNEATKNLILIGGPCTNILVAQLASAGKFPYTCSNWPPENFGLIYIIDSAYASGKSIVVIAGTRDSDISLAASVLENYQSFLSNVNVNFAKITGTVNAPIISSSLPSPLNTCTDSDGGLNYYTKGQATLSTGANLVDMCPTVSPYKSGVTLLEAYCTNQSPYVVYQQYDCPYGCSNGACIVGNNLTCTDSGNTQNLYMRGFVTYNGTQYYDFCSDSTSVWKMFCNNTDQYPVHGHAVTCPYGCSNGACLSSTPTCTDSDGGISIYTIGYATGLYPINGRVGFFIFNSTCPGGCLKTNGDQFDTYYDNCFNNQINEAYCGSDGSLQAYGMQCPNGCNDGACIIQNQSMYVNTTRSSYVINDTVEVYTHLPNFMDCEIHTINQSGADTSWSSGGCLADGISSSFKLWSNTQPGLWKVKVIAWNPSTPNAKYVLMTPPFSINPYVNPTNNSYTVTIQASDPSDYYVRDWNIFTYDPTGTYKGGGVWSSGTPLKTSYYAGSGTWSLSLNSGTYYLVIGQTGGAPYGTYSGGINVNGVNMQFTNADINHAIKFNVPLQAQGCVNHNDCSQACDNLGINSHWMGSGSSYKSWTGTCPSGVYGCMIGDCCLGQCPSNGSCYCMRTNYVDIYGSVCSAGQTCGQDCYCHTSTPVTEEYKTVNLGETFTLSEETSSPYTWQLKNYDKNYLEIPALQPGGTCGIGSGQNTPTCTYPFTFKSINSGKTSVELDKINSNDNSVAEIKYIYVTINPSSIETAYLNQPFNLEENESAEIVDYRNMIVTLNKLDLMAVATPGELQTVDQPFNITPSGSCNSDGGYAWAISQIDGSYLQLINNGTTNCGSAIGSGCDYYFELRPLKAGTTTISFLCYRPWEGPKNATNSWNVTVQAVEPNPSPVNTTPPIGGGWLATLSIRMPDSSVAALTNVYLGDSVDTPYGVKISFDRISSPATPANPGTATFTVYQKANDFNFNLRTDKYSYSPGENVIIYATLSGDSSFDFKNAVVTTIVTDPNRNQQSVRMYPMGVNVPACTQSITTGTYTCTITNEYYFTGTYVPSNVPMGNYEVVSTAVASGIQKNASTNFEVGNSYSNYVVVSINPEEQHTVIGKEVSYDVTVTDRHPMLMCPTTICLNPPCPAPNCTQSTYTYMISVNGLPYSTKYPSTIQLPAGGSTSFTLMVFPSSTGTIEGVTTATTTTGAINTSSTEQRIVSIVTGEAIATTPVTTRVQPIKEIMFKFTVQATQRDDPSVSASDGAILFVDYIETPNPPPFPLEQEIDIELKNGWNLISSPGYGYYSLGTCSPDSKPVAFIYLANQSRYASFDEATSLMGTDNLKNYLSTYSFWIYSNESCKMAFNVQKYSTYSGVQLYQGWNLIGVTKDMVGETMSNIKSSCALERLYSWNADSQSWTSKTENDLIDKMGYGILARTTTSCSLNTNVIQPPAFPTG